MPFVALSGHIPDVLGNVVEFEVGNLGEVLGDFGLLNFMLVTEGGGGFRIDTLAPAPGGGELLRREGDVWSLPRVTLYTTLHTLIPLKDRVRNRIQFVRVAEGSPINILHVTLQWHGPFIGV
jgi:hypothetical protein